MASQVKPLGINIDLKDVAADPSILFAGWNAPGADVPCNLTHGNFDVAEFAWVATPDPNGIYNLYSSLYDPTTNPTHGGSNYIRIKDPSIDASLETALRSVDLLKIKDEMAKIQTAYVDPANGFPEIALYNWRTVLLNNRRRSTTSSNNSTAATQTWNVEDWWRSQ